MPNLDFKEALDVALTPLDQLWQVQDAKVGKLSNDCTISKLWDVDQWALVQPLALNDHLDHVYQIHRGRQEAFVRADVNHALDDSD